MHKPIVTVVIACLNEENYIENCIRSLLKSDIGSANLEVNVVDGGSSDRSCEIVAKICRENPNVNLYHNPRKKTVFAFNIGIKNAHPSSQYIAIVSAHATFSPDRFSKSIRYFEEYDVEGVGGLSNAISRDETLIGNSIAVAISSKFGNGNSFRNHTGGPKIVETASATMYKRDVFETIGLFNEKLIYSQDIELNMRLKQSGGKILLAPDLVTDYKSRSDLKSFTKHNWRNGLWVILPFAYTQNIPVSIRHLIPLFFVGSLLICMIFVWWSAIFGYLLLAILLAYFSTSLVFAFASAREHNNFALLGFLPIIFFMLHFTYGIASIWGVINLLLIKIR